MIVAPSDRCCKSLVEVCGRYTMGLNFKQLTTISFPDVPDNQDYVSFSNIVKVIHSIEECRMEQHEKLVAEVDTVAVGGLAGAGTEMPSCLCLERQMKFMPC